MPKVGNGNVLRGEASPKAVLTEALVRQIRAMADSGMPMAEIAERLKLNPATVFNVRHRRAWKHVT